MWQKHSSHCKQFPLHCPVYWAVEIRYLIHYKMLKPFFVFWDVIGLNNFCREYQCYFYLPNSRVNGENFRFSFLQCWEMYINWYFYAFKQLEFALIKSQFCDLSHQWALGTLYLESTSQTHCLCFGRSDLIPNSPYIKSTFLYASLS